MPIYYNYTMSQNLTLKWDNISISKFILYANRVL